MEKFDPVVVGILVIIASILWDGLLPIIGAGAALGGFTKDNRCGRRWDRVIIGDEGRDVIGWGEIKAEVEEFEVVGLEPIRQGAFILRPGSRGVE